MGAIEDRQFMGSPADATADLIAKAREWRQLRQPVMADRKTREKLDLSERKVRFELANAALLWLWHQENPAP